MIFPFPVTRRRRIPRSTINDVASPRPFPASIVIGGLLIISPSLKDEGSFPDATIILMRSCSVTRPTKVPDSDTTTDPTLLTSIDSAAAFAELPFSSTTMLRLVTLFTLTGIATGLTRPTRESVRS